MNPKDKIGIRYFPLAVALALMLVPVTARAQAADQNPATPGQTQTEPQANQPEDPLKQLNLTPEQEQKIHTIYAELADQRRAANFRLRQAQRALADAIESPTPDEALIAQRSREVADAQAGTIRVRSLTEARILNQVLTPEQRQRLKELRLEAQSRRRNRMPGADGLRRRNVNNNAPLAPRRKLAKPPQKP